MGKKGKPYLYDIATLIKAGIDPKTGMPIRGNFCGLKDGLKKIFRVIDEQDAVNRYKWFNLPCDLTSEEVETLLYYYGTICFFYFKDLDKFYFMPYTLNGTIDFYGRFNSITPVPIAATSDQKDKKRYESQKKTLSVLKLNVVKAPIDFEDLTVDDFYNSAVLLWDYSRQRSQNIIPRQQLNDAIIELESDILPFARTALINATGVRGLKVDDADASAEAERVSAEIYQYALEGKTYAPFTAKLDVQDLADGSSVKSEEFLLFLTALDNLRLGTFGIKNGGLFQKKAHELQQEADLNGGHIQTQYDDGLSWRQHFCNVVNSIWGTSMWVEPSEAVIGQDLNMDGKLYDTDLGNSGGTSGEAGIDEQGGDENV